MAGASPAAWVSKNELTDHQAKQKHTAVTRTVESGRTTIARWFAGLNTSHVKTGIAKTQTASPVARSTFQKTIYPAPSIAIAVNTAPTAEPISPQNELACPQCNHAGSLVRPAA